MKRSARSRTYRTVSKDFRQINFGFASAELEGAQAPNLLMDGYFDLHKVSAEALTGKDFLILGYKGAGKSAVAERLRLLYERNSQVFITNLSLEDFPYATFAEIIKDETAPEAKYPTAWSWLLLIYLLSSFEGDQLAQHDIPGALRQTMKALAEMGLVPVSGLKALVRSSTKKTLKVSIPKVFERSWESTDSDQDIKTYVENLKKLVCEIRSESIHILIIDGVDEIVTSESAQWNSLGSLIFEVNRLNALFGKSLTPAKIILLCRTDIFELIAGANKNKIRQDSAVDLNWYSDPKDPEESWLVKIANLRATLAFRSRTDLFEEIIPKAVFQKRSTIKTLLDCTRHTPRDFLQLLKYIQKCCTGPQVTPSNVRSGMRKYSIEYFLPEILDELQGYCTGAEAKEFFQLVGSLRSRDFSAKALYEAAEREQRSLTREKIETILRALFECSAIGNVQIIAARGQRFLTYRFRNRHATFNLKESILLHRGLWWALNLPTDPRWDDDQIFPESGSANTSKVPSMAAGDGAN
jgi:hypothetical protein